MDVLTSDQLFFEAQRALDAGNLVAARDLFTRLAEGNPDPAVFQVLAQLAFELGLIEEAKSHLYQVLKLEPGSVEATEGLAKIYYEQGHLRRALEFQEQAVIQRPGDVAGLNTVSMLHFELDETEHALRYADRALAIAPQNVESRLMRARILQKEGRHALAAEAYSAVLTAQPVLLEAQVGLGQCSLQVDDLEQARISFEAAVSQAPRHLDAWKGLAELRARQKEWGEAIAALRRCTELAPSDPEGFVELALAYQVAGDRENAFSVATKILQDFPNAPSVTARLGLLYFRLRNYEGAERMLQFAIAFDPLDAASHENLGSTYLAQRDFLQALKSFQRVWSLRPLAWGSASNLVLAYAYWGIDMIRRGRLDFHWSFGGIEIGGRARSARVLDQGHEFYNAGDYARAAVQYRKVRETDPNYEVACNWLANCRLKQGMLDEAVEVCNAGLSRAPASAPLMALLGTLCLAQAKPQNAVRILKKSLELDPENGPAWLTLGRAHQKAGDFPNALEAYGKAISLSADDPYLYRHMGDMALAQEDRGRAIEAYRISLERSPRDLVACQRLIECYFAGRMYEEAIQSCRHALGIDPRCFTAYMWMGRVFRQLQSFTAAKEAFGKAIAIRPNLIYLHRQLASLHEQLKEYSDAIDRYEQALKIDPEDGEAQRGLARSKRMAGKR